MVKIVLPSFVVAFLLLMTYAAYLQAKIMHLL